MYLSLVILEGHRSYMMDTDGSNRFLASRLYASLIARWDVA